MNPSFCSGKPLSMALNHWEMYFYVKNEHRGWGETKEKFLLTSSNCFLRIICLVVNLQSKQRKTILHYYHTEINLWCDQRGRHGAR